MGPQSVWEWGLAVGGRQQSGTRPRAPHEVKAWLATNPPLDELCEAYPAEWQTVQREVAARSGAEDLAAYASAVSRSAGSDPRAQVRRHLTTALIRQLAVSAATGVRAGRVRFNLLNGWLAQKLLFAHDLERKPVSLRLFRLVWPLVWQRRFLLPLVNKKGIYCFYSRELITELARLIDGRPCLEIAAGDGTLARMLRDRGVDVRATDDHSWDAVRVSDDVERLDASRALRRYQPQVVLCSWPPAGNSFERDVFATDSVQLYIVISSRHEYAAGDWTAYRRQRSFDRNDDEALSQLVLPPELDSAVRLFTRR
ncbi:SAM-dependent methyltransferase [Cryptosporangium sp. NPDC048952]|uniref:SAM-dependent methyltransferase n=1 Tax=Cryptosporangium sp. NPDC048952 TaxID=3363961 RepID=UPI00371FB6C2